ncbi:MAG: heme exporter protein CcmB, partial [Alphaproteobacteria bacterium]|nr:heme exporter protein CcmB [Alphaproteobacteria bacterium]
LFPFGVGADTALLARIAPGLVWVTALLAAMLALDRLFLSDFEDGSMDLLLLTDMPLELVVLAKAAAHWLTTGLPLVLAAPILAVVLNMSGAGFAHLLASLVLGTPTLTLIGAIGAGLTLGARRGGVLISLLVLPLYIPVLIFGVATVQAAIDGIDAGARMMALGGFLLAALALAPLAAAAALRQAAR